MYKIKFHPDVLSVDLKSLSRFDQEKILFAIKEKLSQNPEYFGKPLRKVLKGYYRLRVDFYRVIYQVKRKEVTVFVLKVGKRKDDEVYEEAQKRV